jgi:predicted transcriptional regulator
VSQNLRISDSEVVAMTKAEQFALWCLVRKRRIAPTDVEQLAKLCEVPVDWMSANRALKSLIKKGLAEERREKNLHSSAPLPFFFPAVITDAGKKAAKQLPDNPRDIFAD